ncbi:MAG: glycoside hydrolase family 3 protein [Alkalispirochaeta sp.]
MKIVLLWLVASMIAVQSVQAETVFELEEYAPGEGLFWRDLGEVGFDWPELSQDAEELARDLLEAMSPEERVAQLLMVSWTTEEPTPEIMRWIRERNIGGVKIFGWNGENLPILNDAIVTMQAESLATELSIPLFTATDQEGGWVRHIKDGTSITPGNMAIGATGLPYDAMMSARYIGLELRALGVNMNFAPTVDVYINPEAHVIGPRAFSGDAVTTGLLGVAFFHGLEQTGVIATAKHFPGHGNARGDSHGMLPVIEDDFDTLWERDLLPFRMLVREGVPAVLSGHLSFPEITGDSVPASISPYFKQRVLRDRLNFEGVVITDDLYMGGALEYGRAQGWDFAEIVKRAIEAGNDIVMLSRTPAFNGPIWQRLINAYRDEPGFRERVDESVLRILRIKLGYLRPVQRVPFEPPDQRIREFMRTIDSQEFFLDQAGRSVTVVRDEALPYRPAPGERVLLAGKDPDFFRVGREFFPVSGEFRFGTTSFYSSSSADRRRFASAVESYDTIIFLLSDPNSAQVLETIRETDKRVIVYSILTPVYLADLPWVRTAIAVYGWGRESFETGFAAIRGDYLPSGTLPVMIETMRSGEAGRSGPAQIR